MKNAISVVGVRPDELDFVRTLVDLLRHEDPVVPELTRQALQYLRDSTAHSDPAVSTV